MLVISVLVDTFIVRVFLVPSLVSLLGSLNWFPSKKDPPNKDEYDVSDEMEELLGEDFENNKEKDNNLESNSVEDWEKYMGLKGDEDNLCGCFNVKNRTCRFNIWS
jgi:hypothetical protein